MIKLLLLLTLVPTLALSQVHEFGDWQVDSFIANNVTVAIANTTNESGSVLGILCLSTANECFPYMTNGLTCEENTNYPALVSIDEGIQNVNMECLQLADKHFFLLPQDHLSFMTASNAYGVAFGLEGGKFRAAYFSLNGSAKAAIAAKSMLEKLPKTKRKSDFEDTVL